MITGVQQFNSTNFTGKVPIKGARKLFNGMKTSPQEVGKVIDLNAFNKAVDALYLNLKENPKQILTNLKLTGKALKEAFKAHCHFYTGK